MTESRCCLRVATLERKKSENFCGSWVGGREDGRIHVLALPRREFVILNSCFEEEHAVILVL